MALIHLRCKQMRLGDSIYEWYRKLVETFHVVSECNTAIYFS